MIKLDNYEKKKYFLIVANCAARCAEFGAAQPKSRGAAHFRRGACNTSLGSCSGLVLGLGLWLGLGLMVRFRVRVRFRVDY